MAEYNSFTYDGITSSDFGVYIGGEKTFDAPALRGQSIEIPGRNGNVFISSDSYENVELVYPSFNFEPDLETFRSRLAGLRNALSSRTSYKRLTDTLHPDEFRMAVFRDGFEAKPIKYNTAAEFDIVFDCKPQRFLKSGEIPVEYTPGQTPSDEQTKTGSIATFEAEEGTIISDIKADINPVQDLHGYDKPWAGGNGKNKLRNSASTLTTNGITFTVYDDGSVNVNGTATANAFLEMANLYLLQAGTYIVSGSTNSNAVIIVRETNAVGAQLAASPSETSQFTRDGSKTIGVVLRVPSGATFNNVKIYPMIRLASEADASYEPYSNICPISGWDEMKVSRTGKNLLSSPMELGSIGSTGDNFPDNNNMRNVSVVSILPNTEYTYSQKSNSLEIWANYYYNGVFVSRIKVGSNTRTATFTTPTNVNQIRMRCTLNSAGVLIGDNQLEFGSTATEYEPYNGNIYTINLDGTRYGGTLDVTSGVLTVTMPEVDLGTLNWVYAPGGQGRFESDRITSIVKRPASANTKANIICSEYETITASNLYLGSDGIAINTADGQIWVFANGERDAQAFKTAMSGVQLCYELATPITVQLTPTEIKALLGVNNVWADSGDITVKYGTSPYIIVNPTDFPSKPLLEVTGVGSFWLGDTQITITGTSGQTVYIDCETGECYKVTGGIISPANGLVTLNRLDFPKLASGINNIQLGSGISKVKITPRWWRL